jgi:ketosteroid isomerase-like protein
MATRHAADEADIRQRIDTLVQAIRDLDLEGVKPAYAPDIVSFDIVSVPRCPPVTVSPLADQRRVPSG